MLLLSKIWMYTVVVHVCDTAQNTLHDHESVDAWIELFSLHVPRETEKPPVSSFRCR